MFGDAQGGASVTAMWMLNWYNLIFIVPFGLALLYLALYTLSGWTFGDHDVEAHAHIEVNADAHVAHDHDAAHGNGHTWLSALSWFGIGKVPLSILLMILLMMWGVIGFAANSFQRAQMPQNAQPWLLSIPLAAIGSLIFAKVMSGLLARYVPLSETYARRRHEWLGSVADVVLPVDKKFGLVAVRDRSGELFQLPCRLEAGDRKIEKGSRVQLVAYNADEKLFFVIEHEFPNAPQTQQPSGQTSLR